MIKIQHVKIKFTDDDKFLVISVNYFPKQYSEIRKYYESEEELKKVFEEISDEDTDKRNLNYYIYSKREELELVAKELKNNNSAIPLMFLDSEYNSLKNFCKAWLNHFDFSKATFS